MGVDVNGRDTRFPDAGPDAGTGYPTGTVKTDPAPGQFLPGFKKIVDRATPALPAANTEIVSGLPFVDSHVPMGPDTTHTTTGVAVDGGSALEAARAAARRKAAHK
jgi:hypothetical protein